MLKENLIDYIEKGIKENWDLKAFTNYGGEHTHLRANRKRGTEASSYIQGT